MNPSTVPACPKKERILTPHRHSLDCGGPVLKGTPGRYLETVYNLAMSADQSNMPLAEGKRLFATTQWSVVLAAGDIDQHQARIALAQLCEAYWYPLYAYVRRRVDDVHEAQDLTQAFFAHLLEKQAIARADHHRGRFRDFLVTALKNFLSNEWEKARVEKRGAGKTPFSLDLDSGESRYKIEPSHELTAERLYERRVGADAAGSSVGKPAHRAG